MHGNMQVYLLLEALRIDTPKKVVEFLVNLALTKDVFDVLAERNAYEQEISSYLTLLLPILLIS